jgi:hypothetical protein
MLFDLFVSKARRCGKRRRSGTREARTQIASNGTPIVRRKNERARAQKASLSLQAKRAWETSSWVNTSPNIAHQGCTHDESDFLNSVLTAGEIREREAQTRDKVAFEIADTLRADARGAEKIDERFIITAR